MKNKQLWKRVAVFLMTTIMTISSPLTILADTVVTEDAVIQESIPEEEMEEVVVEEDTEALMQARDPVEQEVRITLNMSVIANEPGTSEEFVITSGEAVKYGLTKREATADQVTALDALAAWSAAEYGEDFTANPSDYLESTSTGFVTKIFGIETSAIGFLINNVVPGDDSGMGYAWDQAVLNDGDQLTIFMYNDDTFYTDAYVYFEGAPSVVTAGEEITFNILGFYAISDPGTTGSPVEDCVVVVKNVETGDEVAVNVGEDGVFSYTPAEAGIYDIYLQDCEYEYFVAPQITVEVEESNGPSAEELAMQHIQETYLADGKRLISNGGTSITQEGNKIHVGLYTSSGSSISTVRFNAKSPSSQYYKTGLFLPQDDGDHIFYKVPTTAVSTSCSIYRETTPYTFTVTLKVYDLDTADEDINNDAATALAEQDFEITLEAAEPTYDVSFVVKDSVTKEPIENATLVVYKTYDWADAITPTNNVYTLKAGDYKYNLSANGYIAVKDQVFTPSESGEAELFLTPEGPSEEDQAKVDAVKERFDQELGALRPSFKTDKNIVDFVQSKVSDYTDLDTDNVTVSLKTSEDQEIIAQDGTIGYNQGELSYVNSLSTDCTFTFSCNGAEAESGSRRVLLGWDQDHFKEKMQSEADTLTWDNIKGNNESAEEVTENLSLPRVMGTSARYVWSEILWSSSNESVIEFQDTGYGSLVDPKSGVIHAQEEDTVVTLTATFQANGTVLNTNVEQVADFGTITKTFDVTVKGTKEAKPTEEELLELLNQYYTADLLNDYVSGETLDTENCMGDIQLPRYTRIQDDQGNNVFVNREITVTSSNEDILRINGYRVYTDIFAADEDTVVDLIVTFTRDEVTVSKNIPITVKMINEADLDAEIEMMELAKEHYFDGINDGLHEDKDSITGNLRAFQEMILDEEGNPQWIYNSSEMKGNGIIADDMIDDPWEMEAAGYRAFRSSDINVIQADNLVVTRPETDTQVTISSMLSSEKYRAFAAAHTDNEKLQKLYKQEVSVTVTIKGTKGTSEALEKEIAEAEELLASMEEGSEPGQYPEGTKEKLQKAIDEAKAVLNNGSATEEEQNAALTALTETVQESADAQNEQIAEITLSVNENANEKGDVQKITVRAGDTAVYGYIKSEENKKEATALDAIVAYHASRYGDDFTENPENYLKVSGGYINKIFGIDTYGISFFINDRMPSDGEGNSYTWEQAVLKTGDTMTVFLYGDTSMYSDYYISFAEVPDSAKTGEEISFKVFAEMAAWATGGAPNPAEDTTISLTNRSTGEELTCAVTEDGTVTFTAKTPGVYEAAVKETDYEFYVAPSAEINVTCSHSYSAWKTKTEATVFKAETQTRTCKICGKTQTRTYGKKLKPTITLNSYAFPLQVGKTTTRIRVWKLAKGDYVKSWKSSNPSIVKVTNKGVITATKKTGKAVLTVTLASGKTAKTTVTVQKAGVKTKSMWHLPKTATVKKGKTYQLEPIRSPITSQQKITYASSNKKVATVDKNGKIKGVKKGKAVITVKSGSAVKKVTVTVK